MEARFCAIFVYSRWRYTTWKGYSSLQEIDTLKLKSADIEAQTTYYAFTPNQV